MSQSPSSPKTILNQDEEDLAIMPNELLASPVLGGQRNAIASTASTSSTASNVASSIASIILPKSRDRRYSDPLAPPRNLALQHAEDEVMMPIELLSNNPASRKTVLENGLEQHKAMMPLPAGESIPIPAAVKAQDDDDDVKALSLDESVETTADNFVNAVQAPKHPAMKTEPAPASKTTSSRDNTMEVVERIPLTDEEARAEAEIATYEGNLQLNRELHDARDRERKHDVSFMNKHSPNAVAKKAKKGKRGGFKSWFACFTWWK